ncbi:50S ribosomal protein L10 [Mucisphaera calidilacus]|uniref:Large ribosomal subunit protein uL10 n=1 Tax=Mucisphaera calidilacus TaxID=2527982 RepID=A0A518BXY7_9BACT|nr:50S ribosomal protein L10 [Mucisphaera calidilacus]QDU71832.1 50S ribosomal protein L10 [Mucisphaera calidilacus]
MSKPVKELINQSYKSQFTDRDGLVIVDIRGIKASDNIAMRKALADKGMKVTVVKNTIARKAIEGTELEPVGNLLTGACAFVYSVDGEQSIINIARSLVDEAKKMPCIVFKGAVMEGYVFAEEDGVKELSKYPTREEAIAKLVGAILGPASKLSGALKGPFSTLAGLIKAVEEKGGEVEKVAS